ncbi:MAG: radical SAM/SPASM domain-containing protein, partial [bacterium]
CEMCPRNMESTPEGNMPMEIFEKLEPCLGKIRSVFLAGFGEPLIHPQLPEMIDRCKAKGCYVLFATNGFLLVDNLADRLLRTKIDAIAVSIDAGDAKTYLPIRGRSLQDFDRLIEILRILKEARARSEHKPYMYWCFVMMKKNIHTLPQAVRLAAELGFDNLTAKHMESGTSYENLGEALYNTGIHPPIDDETEQRYQQFVAEARGVAKKCNITLDVHPREYQVGHQCLNEPLRRLYVDYRGNVSKCCYLNIHDVRPYQKKRNEDNGIMGNLKDASLEAILEGEKHRVFVAAWEQGRIPEACHGCVQLERVDYHKKWPKVDGL